MNAYICQNSASCTSNNGEFYVNHTPIYPINLTKKKKTPHKVSDGPREVRLQSSLIWIHIINEV